VISWVQVLIDLPEPARPAGEAFWSAALGAPLGEPNPEHTEYASFVPPSGTPWVHRQIVGDGPPRVHLDLEVTDLDAEIDRLRALGAAVGRRDGDEWVGLTSPGGAPFCLLGGLASQDRPPPVTGRGGVRRRLVQVCLDIPYGQRAAETAFWRSALPWRWTDIDEPDFVGRLVPPAGAPLQVLLQELGADDPGTTVRAHLDRGSDDLETTVDELVALGAERLGTGRGWVPLRDPAGMVFCVTGQPPHNP
jgi:hypothetical protein